MRPIVVLVGVSASGKSTLLRELLKRRFVTAPVSCTTRPMRRGERNGVDYHFVSVEHFRFMCQHDLFIEHDESQGKDLYGTLRGEMEGALKRGLPVLLDTNFHGAEEFKKSEYGPFVSVVFINTPPEEARRRMLADTTRKHSEEEISSRLEKGRVERAWAPNADFFIDNRDMDQALEELIELIGILDKEKEPELSRFSNPTIIRRCTKVASQ